MIFGQLPAAVQIPHCAAALFTSRTGAGQLDEFLIQLVGLKQSTSAWQGLTVFERIHRSGHFDQDFQLGC